ncbi:MAG: serine hydrolase family protein [Crocinitomicaceae bacterium]|nr:serine hydrolase family protein [Crocinitomicaceae bacterium]
MKERQIEFAQTRRYYQNEIDGKKHILLALHGYGQLSQYFYRKFHALENDFGLVIPEGPHRFYLEGSSGRVGASWMTKEWRAQDIEDNNRYLLQLIEKVQLENPDARLHLLGFSQGGATAARLYQADPSLFSQLILWASVFPPDIAMEQFPKGKKMDFVIGSKDPYFDSESSARIQNEYTELGFEIHTFEGAHDIHSQTLLAVLTNTN